MDSLKVDSTSVDLDGGRQLRVSRYVDPSTERAVITLAPTWADDPIDFPSMGRDVLTLPEACANDLIAALQKLGGGGG